MEVLETIEETVLLKPQMVDLHYWAIQIVLMEMLQQIMVIEIFGW